LKKIDILECTLRDGSYTVDFQFNLKETADIVQALDKAGFKYIEVGHGLGLNASKTKGKALCSDGEYLLTAKDRAKKAKIGMFFIPGIGRKKDIDKAVNLGLDFIRVGTNVTEADKAVEYIKYAKESGLYVTSNLMKSYALPVAKFLEKAILVEDAGVDVIEVVDSAGCMLPDDIEEYVSAIKLAGIQSRIGYHGHNNFSLAVANSLKAIESGATLVDTSLLGLGRNAGNTSTEIFSVILNKLGYNKSIDIFETMDVAEKIVRPIIERRKGLDNVAITCGYAEFHSSYLPIIYKIAKKYKKDPRRLMVAVVKKDTVHLTEELAEKVARRMR